MSKHNHDHDKNCGCGKCKTEKHDAEQTSIEEAGGVAVGLTGHIQGYNADVGMRFSGVLLTTGMWVVRESGSLLGHIKAAVFDSEGDGLTFSLTDIENGVEQHGTLSPREIVHFNFMSAVVDVAPHDLEHVMIEALEESGIDYSLEPQHRHDHDHDHCNCGHDHHEHGHQHHHDGCGCKACEERRQAGTKKGTIWDKLRRKNK